MDKKELFLSMWIDIKKRMPPNNENLILVQLASDHIKTTTGKVVRQQIKNLKAGEYQLFDEGFSATHWMKVYNAENKKIKTKKRRTKKAIYRDR